MDAEFALDMQAHHRQAVQMSTLVRDRVEDEDVRTLALDVALTQQQQAGQMYGWRQLWGLGQGRTQPVMAWMAGEDVPGPAMAGHDMTVPADGLGAVGDMPGMASAAQMDALAAADGEEAARIYLQLMIPHHVAGVEMARAAAQEAAEPEVRALAEKMATGQEAELTVLRDMLAERGGPVPGV